MTSQRQQAFQQLRPPCVELNSIALRFTAKQASVKQVSLALDVVRDVLNVLHLQHALDEKLAEYAFFPLTHVFNEAQRLSSACLETAVRCTIVLIGDGWRQNLIPEMGKQLLILMSLLAGGDPRRQGEAPSDDLKAIAFSCIGEIVQQLAKTNKARHLFDDLGLRNVVDQLVYVLLESVSDSPSDKVQLAAADALLQLTSSISNHVLLASLLPRTTSSLTKALRTSTRARRTRMVLVLDLKLLTSTLRSVLSDSVLWNATQNSNLEINPEPPVSDVLGDSWIRATAPQVQTALTQVVKLQTHESLEVRQGVADLCLMVVEECCKSLSGSLPLMLDTLVSIAQNDDDGTSRSALKHLVTSRPDVVDVLRSRFYDWSQTLPRVLQGNDDRPKSLLLGQMASVLIVTAESSQFDDNTVTTLTDSLLSSLTSVEDQVALKQRPIEATEDTLSFDLTSQRNAFADFVPVLLNQPNQRQVAAQLEILVGAIIQSGLSERVSRVLVEKIPDSRPTEQLVASWVALACLKRYSSEELDVGSILDLSVLSNESTASKPYLVSDLYACTLPFLQDSDRRDDVDWRLTAVALECAVLQAEQLDVSYRPELLDTLYPVLSLLGSRNAQLRVHAITALNKLAAACKYNSTSDMLIGNADYLINAVGMKLNSFDVSPQAPQVLLMLLRLCGAQIIPYLDDLIGSIFTALDNFHGYPRLVELLFQVMRGVVQESTAQPELMLTQGVEIINHKKPRGQFSTVDDILGDLRRRKSRKRKFAEEHQALRKAPERQWKSTSSGKEGEISKNDQAAPQDLEDEAITNSPVAEDKKKLSKTHQLLLNIAQATGPHLTSPSPQVRQILLDLLTQVSPLLAQDENSFLPLINMVWPAIVPRLLNHVEDGGENEAFYNICAAADVISTLCKGAGSFMSSRIEAVLPQVEKLFREVSSRTLLKKQGMQRDNLSLTEVSAAITKTGPGQALDSGRSADSQITDALIRLLSTILTYVRLTDDDGDKIAQMLTPFSTVRSGEVLSVLDEFNADEMWLRTQDASHSGPFFGPELSKPV